MKRLLSTILALTLSASIFAVSYSVRNYCEDCTAFKFGTQSTIDENWKAAGCEAHTVRDFSVLEVIDAVRGVRSYLANNLSVTFSGAETKTALTQTIPGGTIGANGCMVVHVDCKKGTGNPSMKIKFGGTEIASTTADSNLYLKTYFWNQGAENDNFYNHEWESYGYASMVVAGGTDTTIDTSVDKDVTVELTSTGAGTTIVRGVKIVVYYKE